MAGNGDAAPRLGGRRELTFQPRCSVKIGAFTCPIAANDELSLLAVEEHKALLHSNSNSTLSGDSSIPAGATRDNALNDDVFLFGRRAENPEPVGFITSALGMDMSMLERLSSSQTAPAANNGKADLLDEEALLGHREATPTLLGFVNTAMGMDMSLLEVRPPRRQLIRDDNASAIPGTHLNATDRPSLDLGALEDSWRSPCHVSQPAIAPGAASVIYDSGSDKEPVADPSVPFIAHADTTAGDATLPNDVDPRSLFIDSLQLPLSETLVHTPPRQRAARREPTSLVPRRSGRLAAKSAFCRKNRLNGFWLTNGSAGRTKPPLMPRTTALRSCSARRSRSRLTPPLARPYAS